MANLDNCSQCGKLYVKALGKICNDCNEKRDQQFLEVKTFIRARENRQATLPEVCEGTGVPEYIISQFIKEGRLKITHLPNLGYPCESCGASIRENKLCKSCVKQLGNDIEKLNREEQVTEKKKQEQENSLKSQQTYQMFDDRLKR